MWPDRFFKEEGSDSVRIYFIHYNQNKLYFKEVLLHLFMMAMRRLHLISTQSQERFLLKIHYKYHHLDC